MSYFDNVYAAYLSDDDEQLYKAIRNIDIDRGYRLDYWNAGDDELAVVLTIAVERKIYKLFDAAGWFHTFLSIETINIVKDDLERHFNKQLHEGPEDIILGMKMCIKRLSWVLGHKYTKEDKEAYEDVKEFVNRWNGILGAFNPCPDGIL